MCSYSFVYGRDPEVGRAKTGFLRTKTTVFHSFQNIPKHHLLSVAMFIQTYKFPRSIKKHQPPSYHAVYVATVTLASVFIIATRVSKNIFEQLWSVLSATVQTPQDYGLMRVTLTVSQPHCNAPAPTDTTRKARFHFSEIS